MSIDYLYDGKITIGRGEGISQAIRDELGLTQEECNKLGLSIWTEIMEQVKEQKKTSSEIYAGGGDLSGPANENFVVQDGNVIEFSRKIWNNIVGIINDSNKLNRKLDELAQDDTNPPAKDDNPPPPKDDNPPTLKDDNLPTEFPFEDVLDSNGRVIMSYIKAGWYDRYFYNDDGKIDKKISYDLDGNGIGYDKYEYDQNGNVTKKTCYESDGSLSVYHKYEYGQDGKETQCTSYNSDGIVSEYYKYEYDQDGKRKTIVYDPNGKLLDQYYE